MKALAIIGISAVVFLLAFGFLPASGAVGGSRTVNGANCNYALSFPTGTYSQGSTESASVSASCKGIGDFALVGPGGVVAANIFICPCTNTPLFSTVLSPGLYTLVVTFAGASNSFDFHINSFLVASELPVGTALAVIAPVAALVGYTRFRKPRL